LAAYGFGSIARLDKASFPILRGLSRDVLAATLGVAIADLPTLPFAAAEPLIVDRVNPVDP
jgi:hypothetical protein